jgi:hypothetical protein
LVSKRALRTFFEFENEGFFLGAGQGHMLRFALTTIVGAGQKIARTDFLFQGKRIAELSDQNRVFTLSPDDILQVNPNTKTCPIFQSKHDAELTKATYARVPVLVREVDAIRHEGNPWGIRFMAMFHMANDSHLFKNKTELERQGFVQSGNHFARKAETYLPLYEAKMMTLYSHRHGDFNDTGNSRAHVLPTIPVERLQNCSYVPEPFYWVSSSEIDQAVREINWPFRWLLGWRKITDSRASARTLIFSLLPYFGVGDSLNLMFPKELSRKTLYTGLVANISSLIIDYVVRTKVGGLNLNYFAMKQFPVFAPEFYSEADVVFICPRVLELTYTAADLTPWARDLGYDGPPFKCDEDRRANLRAELDAWYARAYGLTRDELRYILDPADVKGPDYPSETFRVLKKNEIARFGEYRTARLVLGAWNRLERGELAA